MYIKEKLFIHTYTYIYIMICTSRYSVLNMYYILIMKLLRDMKA